MTDRLLSHRLRRHACIVPSRSTYGIFSVRWNTFPNHQIALAETTIRDLSA